MNAAEDEDPAALRRKRVDDGFDLSKPLSRMQLRFGIIIALQQFQVCDGFETHHLVAASGINDEIARYREEIGASRSHILPVFRSIGAGQNLSDHIVQLVGGR